VGSGGDTRVERSQLLGLFKESYYFKQFDEYRERYLKAVPVAFLLV